MRTVGFFVLFSCAIASAQTPVGSTSADATALRAQAIEAAGGATAIAAIKDYTATGTITFFDDQKEESAGVAIKSLGKDLLRFDALLGSGTRSWTLRGAFGRAKHGDSKAVNLSTEVGLSLSNYALPVAVLARTEATAYNSERKEGDAASLQRLTKISAEREAPGAKPTDYQVDAQTGRIVRVSSQVRTRPGMGPILQEFSYADFRAVEGVLFPFVIEEWSGGQLVSRIQLETVSINTGLKATDFGLE